MECLYGNGICRQAPQTGCLESHGLGGLAGLFQECEGWEFKREVLAWSVSGERLFLACRGGSLPCPRGLPSARTERALCLPLIRTPVLSALLPRPHFTRIPSFKALSPNTSRWGSVLPYMKLGTGTGIAQSITGCLRFGSSCIPSGEGDCVFFTRTDY